MALGETNLPRNLWRIGEDFSFNIPVNTTGDSTGTPVTVNTYALSFVLKSRERDASSMIPAKTTAGGAITFANGVHPIGSPLAGQSTGGTNDMAKVDIDAADHVNLTPGRYFWALWRTDAGQNRRLAWGTVEAVLGATQ